MSASPFLIRTLRRTRGVILARDPELYRDLVEILPRRHVALVPSLPDEEVAMVVPTRRDVPGRVVAESWTPVPRGASARTIARAVTA